MFKMSDGIYADPDVILFNCAQHGFSIGPTPVFMAAIDSVQSRFNIILYASFCEAFNKYPLSLVTEIEIIISLIEHIQPLLGVETYNVVKNWEPLVIGDIIKCDKVDMGFVHLFNTVVDEIREAVGENVHILSRIINCLTLSLFPHSKQYDHMQLELTGLSKHFGHPHLRVDKMFTAVKKIGKEVKREDVEELLAFSRKTFAQRYFFRHNCWPPGNYPACFQKKYVNRAHGL